MKRYSPEQLAKQAANEAKWRGVLADWASGKLDGRSYCREKRISEHLFYHWKRVIRLRDQDRVAGYAHDEKPAPGQGSARRSSAPGAKRLSTGRLAPSPSAVRIDRAHKRGAKGNAASGQPGRRPATGSQPRFIPVHLRVSGPVELRHMSGHVLVIHEGCGEELLCRALSALERTC